MLNIFRNYLKQRVSTNILAVFRIGFGVLMFVSTIRFLAKGWVKTLYIEPEFHFKYYGFEWINSLGEWTYLLFIVCSASSLFIALGLKYRLSMISFFLTFSYIELIDKTTYLNHYYFISILSFLLIFIPLNSTFSIDNIIQKRKYLYVPKWSVDSIKLLITIVYIYAGVAKINADWLLNAQPLSIWLTSKYDLPIIGNLLQISFIHYLFSWCGMLYDLTIPFFLLYKKTRKIGFYLVIIFHVMTAILFPRIGMFPYIMMLSTIIFLSVEIHNSIINKLKNIIDYFNSKNEIDVQKIRNIKYQNTIIYFLSFFFIIQLLLPMRHLCYKSNLFWSEEGYRFSWRVMLIEKKGYSIFKVLDTKSKKLITVNNEDFLTPFQEKQMSFQADFILEYAHFIGDFYKKKGFLDPAVFVESYVTLNGNPSRRFINNTIDLYKEKESFKHKSWILP